MATIDSLPLGRFCWIELGTNDQGAAKGFYGDVFGWTPADRPMGKGATYTLLKLGGRDAGALYALTEEQKGVPPHWMVYVSVRSADEAARKAQGLGAKVIAPPFDVMDSGRMAVLEDPTGANFSVWEGRAHKGLQVSDEAGAFCWGELRTKDPAKAVPFYAGLFGWGAKADAQGEYTEWTTGGRSIGGMIKITSDWGDMPSHWAVYFQVNDCDATVGRVKSLGGRAYEGPRDVAGVGRFAVLADPQGASFSVITLQAPDR